MSPPAVNLGAREDEMTTRMQAGELLTAALVTLGLVLALMV